jgi:hypothetical protein
MFAMHRRGFAGALAVVAVHFACPASAASEFCRDNAGADIIPMAATGHDTIYDWRCVGRRAVATKAVVAVDAQGYDAGNWKELH